MMIKIMIMIMMMMDMHYEEHILCTNAISRHSTAGLGAHGGQQHHICDIEHQSPFNVQPN
eukprot:6238268-Karenia_brevis.AAC.1